MRGKRSSPNQTKLEFAEARRGKEDEDTID